MDRFFFLKKAAFHIGLNHFILKCFVVSYVFTHFCYCLVTVEISRGIVTSCLSVPMGHFSLVIFPNSINPDLFTTAEHQVFISKYRIALLQFPSVMGMC